MNGLTLTCQVVWPKMSKCRDISMWYQHIGKQLQVAYPIWDTSLLTELDMVTMEQLFTDANLLDVWEARRPGFQKSRNCLSEPTFSSPEFGWWFAASGMSWTLLAFSGMMSYPWENNNACNFAGRGCRCPMDGECRKLYLIGIKDQKSQIGTRNISSECVRYRDTVYARYLCRQFRYAQIATEEIIMNEWMTAQLHHVALRATQISRSSSSYCHCHCHLHHLIICTIIMNSIKMNLISFSILTVRERLAPAADLIG